MNVSIRIGEEQSRKLLLLSAVENSNIEEYISFIVNKHIESIDAKALMVNVGELFGVKQEETKKEIKPAKKKTKQSDSSILKIGDYHHKPYSNIQIKRCKFVSVSVRREQELLGTVNDALLIKELSPLTFGQFKELSDKMGILRTPLYRFVWNVTEGYFDKHLDEFKSKVNQVSFSTKDDKLYINDEECFSVFDAKLLLHTFVNCKNNKEECIWKLIKNHPQLDELHIRLLCENINDEKLTNILKTTKQTTIVNNREKRENLLIHEGKV